MVLTLLPLTTTSRRRACAWPCPCGSELAVAAALCIAQPVKAIPLAGLLGTRSPLKDIPVSPLYLSVRARAYNALIAESPQAKPCHRGCLGYDGGPCSGEPAMADHDHDHHDEHHSELSETQLRVRALETILTEKGYIDPAALDAIVEAYE